MNAMDILKYGHLTVLHTLEGVEEQHWTTPNVCGWWSTKDIIAHLASFEHMLVEILSGLLGDNGPTPYLAQMLEDPERFNEVHVGTRQRLTPTEALAEYVETQTTTMALAGQIPTEMFRQNGALPWYGAEYDLDDFICYTYYGHKREHTAQINVFKDMLGAMTSRAAV